MSIVKLAAVVVTKRSSESPWLRLIFEPKQLIAYCCATEEKSSHPGVPGFAFSTWIAFGGFAAPMRSPPTSPKSVARTTSRSAGSKRRLNAGRRIRKTEVSLTPARTSANWLNGQSATAKGQGTTRSRREKAPTRIELVYEALQASA